MTIDMTDVRTACVVEGTPNAIAARQLMHADAIHLRAFAPHTGSRGARLGSALPYRTSKFPGASRAAAHVRSPDLDTESDDLTVLTESLI